MWGDEGRYRSELARERTARDATKSRLRDAEARISVLEARPKGPRSNQHRCPKCLGQLINWSLGVLRCPQHGDFSRDYLDKMRAQAREAFGLDEDTRPAT